MAKYLDQAGLTSVLKKINDIYQRKITLTNGSVVNDSFVTGMTLTADAEGTSYTLSISHAAQKYDTIQASYTGTGMKIASITDHNGTGSASTLSIAYASASTGGVLTDAQATKLNGIATGANKITVSNALTKGLKIGTITTNDSATQDLYVTPATDSTIGVVKPGTGLDVDTNGTLSVNVSELGLSSAMKWTGKTVNADPTETAPTGGPYTTGDVISYNGREFAYNGTSWIELGDESSFALKTVTITAGTGLSGGGTLAANRTINLQHATTGEIGGIKITNLTGKTSGRDYNVGITNDDVAYVNVPWTDESVTSVNTHYKTTGMTAGTSYNSTQSPAAGATFKIPVLSYDAAGHITAVTTTNVTMPESINPGNGTLTLKTGSTNVATHSANTTSDVTVLFSGTAASGDVGALNITANATNHTFTFGTTATADSRLTDTDINDAWNQAIGA
jgi:hypothetical protein